MKHCWMDWIRRRLMQYSLSTIYVFIIKTTGNLIAHKLFP
jgi:hypothetical protein